MPSIVLDIADPLIYLYVCDCEQTEKKTIFAIHKLKTNKIPEEDGPELNSSNVFHRPS